MRVGFLGLGIMGSRMAANLLKNGHALRVHNRTRAKAETLLAMRAEWAESPAELAGQVDVLFTMLSTPDAVRENALGDQGFLPYLGKNAIWVDCSTVDPAFSRDMAAQAQSRGVRFVDAPVAGSMLPAEKGELLFLVGGAEADVEACRPLFESMGRKVLHVGGNGMGASLKLVFNLLLGNAMAAFSEALVLGQSLGIPQGQLLDSLLAAPVTAPFLASKRAKFEQGEYSPEFPLEWMHKDFHLVAQTAYNQGVALPMTNLVKELYALAMRNGLEKQDFSALYALLSAAGRKL